MKRCDACGTKTNTFRLFRCNDGRMVCQTCRHSIDYDKLGRPVPPRQINSIMGMKMIIPIATTDKDGNTKREVKEDCYYFDMCRERYGCYFNCKPCKVYSKYRGDY